MSRTVASMRTLLSQIVPQPLVAIVTSGCSLIALGWVWFGAGYASSGNLSALPLALALSLAVVVAGQYPIHYGYRLKMEVTTIPLYLMAVLLPPPVASLSTGLGILILELSQKSNKGNQPSAIATAAGRWVLIGLAGASIAHLPVSGQLYSALELAAAALLMFIADAGSISFELWPMTKEPPWRSFVKLVKEGALIEGVQYFLGMLGALAALQQTWALILLVLPAGIVYLAFKTRREMQNSTRKLLEGMADAVDLRDPYTGGHSRQVAELVAQVLRELNVFGLEAELITSAARVHDIGKIALPDGILNKKAKLTPEEWDVMRSHPGHGAELLARYSDFARGAGFVRAHHERWDGKGYSRGLKGSDIPFGGRVIAVADAYHAMTSDRPYRRAMPTEQAVLILRAGGGTQWDPFIVDAFIRVVTQSKQVSERAGQPSTDQEAPTA